ncbi:Crp/Fnr family transcriptional regulator [Primorskyibacter sp. S87]|uniref:Crp/Fnr family transcriptional regulator n=1 Tax=Primorskyibacter sp. S87 TaxID=3415126 RepID=UPI003C79CE34
MNNTLPDTGFLASASERLKQMLTGQAREIHLEAGEVLFEQGDDGDSLYAVIEGALEFSILSLNGRKLVLDVAGPGAVFGEIALFDPGPRTATVTALDSGRLSRIRYADVLAKFHHHPELATDMLRLAGQRMRLMGHQLNEQVFLPVPTRLARKILYLTQELAPRDTIKMSQSELADFVGATREAVSKTLSVWKREGILDGSRGGITILDRSALSALAEPDQI